MATPEGKENTGQNQESQTYTRRATKNFKMEESKRAQRKIFNWKRRQQKKLEKNTEVLDVSEFLRKMFLKKSRF